MDERELRDVKDVIARSTSKVTLKELQKQGFRKVKVLKQNDIHDLIKKAVDAVLESREDGLDGKDRDEYIEESKRELKRLMKQAAQAQQRQADLEDELRRIQAQKVQMEEERKSLQRQVEQGTVGQPELIRKYEQQIEALQREAAEVATVRESNYRLESQVEELSRRLQEAEQHRATWLEADGGASQEEIERLRAEHMELVRKLKNVTVSRNLLEQVELPKIQKALDEERSLRAHIEERMAQVGGAGGGGERLEEMFKQLMGQMVAQQRSAAAVDPAALQEQLARMSEHIAAQVSSRVGSGGPARTAESAVTADVALAGLFAHEDEKVESNIAAVEVKTKQEAGGVKSNLAKLRALKGGKNA